MNILITGSNGFVGSNLVDFLERKNRQNKIIGTGTKISPSSKVDQYFKWNIAVDEFPSQLLDESIDVIIHAACLDRDRISEELILTNCLGTYRVYQLAMEAYVKRVYYISSIPVIGTPRHHPITEKHFPVPESMYHATKLSGEFILNQLKDKRIEIVNLRIPSPIGPGMAEKTVLPIFVRRAINNQNIIIKGHGTRKQNYLDIRDLAELIENSLKLDNISGTYNIASQKSISNLDLAKLCIKITNSKSRIVFLGEPDPNDEQVWDVDCTKARDLLDYGSKISIECSIRDIAEYIRTKLTNII